MTSYPHLIDEYKAMLEQANSALQIIHSSPEWNAYLTNLNAMRLNNHPLDEIQAFIKVNNLANAEWLLRGERAIAMQTLRELEEDARNADR